MSKLLLMISMLIFTGPVLAKIDMTGSEGSGVNTYKILSFKKCVGQISQCVEQTRFSKSEVEIEWSYKKFVTPHSSNFNFVVKLYNGFPYPVIRLNAASIIDYEAPYDRHFTMTYHNVENIDSIVYGAKGEIVSGRSAIGLVENRGHLDQSTDNILKIEFYSSYTFHSQTEKRWYLFELEPLN